jgi:hypothetical protein
MVQSGSSPDGGTQDADEALPSGAGLLTDNTLLLPIPSCSLCSTGPCDMFSRRVVIRQLLSGADMTVEPDRIAS